MKQNAECTLTSDEALRRAFGPNVLLDVTGAFIDTTEMPSKLANRPLDRVPWQEVIVRQRVDFVEMLRVHFVPTPDAIQIAYALQKLIRAGYIERNPFLACNRARRRAIARIKLDELRTAPWFPTFARAMVVSGITGLGKTLIVKRALELYPTTHIHGPSVEGGWEQQIQLVHLFVQMSGDTSRLGFLDNILQEIDSATRCTNYYDMYGGPKSRMSTEKLMVKIGQILSQLYCGVLVIDEIQLRNFSGDQDLVLLFFLRLLNFGIPIVLIGNPNGFDGFQQSAQDTRRLYSGGNFELWPAFDKDDEAWETYVKGKLDFALMPLSFPADKRTIGEFYRCTAGVPGYFDQLWGAIQEKSLRGNSASIPFEDIGKVYESAKMTPYRKTIKGLVERDLNRLAVTKDIDITRFAEWWDIDLPSADQCSTEASAAAPAAKKTTLEGRGAKDKLPKPRASRSRQADAMFRRRQQRAAQAQQAALEQDEAAAGPAARTKANRSALKAGAEQLLKPKSAGKLSS
ncbi:ATP-binding protein [Paraburkholderia caribensis]|uniref:ATP-binding protein n=1 Tax=Paraburkholderia caribensis TaxID=75105 RepID=UPI001590A23A|nr:ATP-binding protein [Paraburkholderia caribensis]